MNTLQRLRGDLRDLFTEAGFTITTHLPERIVPPLAIVAPGSPYLEDGESFGKYRARFTVFLVCATGTNDTVTDQLDELVASAVVALDDSPWLTERVDQPSMLEHGRASFLSTTIDVATVTDIDDGRD